VGAGSLPAPEVSYFGGWEMSLVESLNILSVQRKMYLTL
jgi:hypothetical protein